MAASGYPQTVKIALLAIAAWLGGAVTFLALIGELGPGALTGVAGFLTVLGFVIGAPVAGLFFGFVMFAVRRRGFNQALGPSSLTGALLGILPGIALGLAADGLRSIDRSPKPLTQALLSPDALSGIAAGIVAGAVFGAGFWVLFERQRP
jgi:hypothetical protein